MPHPSQNETSMSDRSGESWLAVPAAQTCPELIGAMKDAIRVSGDVMSTGIVWEAEEESATAASAPRAPARRPSR